MAFILDRASDVEDFYDSDPNFKGTLFNDKENGEVNNEQKELEEQTNKYNSGTNRASLSIEKRYIWRKKTCYG